jgi:hypothetical protein
MVLAKWTLDIFPRFKGKWRAKITSSYAVIFLLMLLALPFIYTNGSGEGDHTRFITGRTDISDGLPGEASFTTVEVFDTDSDGLDEIYLGGSGSGSPRTQGIRAYEYNTIQGHWNKFGHGLVGMDSGKYYGALSLGDLDKDGNIDIVAPLLTKWYGGSKKGIEIYAGDGVGGFSLEYTIETGESVNEADVKDLDSDGNLDIAVSTEFTLRVWFGTGTLDDWIEKSPPRAGNEITGMDAGDLNDDGLLDLVGCPYFGSTKVRMYIQSSGRTWEEISFKEVRNEAFGIKIADLDDDGNSDVVYGTRNDGIKAWLGNGGGSPGGTDFQWKDGSAGLHDSGGQWQQLEVRDITGDGKPELIAANNGGDKVYLYLNDYPNGWSWIFRGDSDSDLPIIKEEPLTIGGEPYGTNFGDWDGDGLLDIAACSWNTGVKAWLIDGNSTNQTGENNYPEGGVTPPRIWGYDDYFFLTVFLLLGIGIFGFGAVATRLGFFGAKRDRAVSVDGEGEEDGTLNLIRGNVRIIMGFVILILLQIIAIIFSLTYGPDSNILSFWNPPEIAGVMVYSFHGFIAFLIFYEIGFTYLKRGMTDIDKSTDNENSLSETILHSSMILKRVNRMIYFFILFLFVLTVTLYYYNIWLDIIIIIFVTVMPMAASIFTSLNYIIPIRMRKQKTVPILILIICIPIVIVTVILSIYVLAFGSDILNITLFYPLICGILFLVWSVLNIKTFRRFHTSLYLN